MRRTQLVFAIVLTALYGCAGPNTLVKTELKGLFKEISVFEKPIMRVRPARNNAVLVMLKGGRLVLWSPQDGVSRTVCDHVAVSPSRAWLGYPSIQNEYHLWDVSGDGEFVVCAEPMAGVVVRNLGDLSAPPVTVLTKEQLKEKLKRLGDLAMLRVSNGGRAIAFLTPQDRNIFRVAIMDVSTGGTGYLVVPFAPTGSAGSLSASTDKEFDWPYIGGFSMDGAVLLVSRSRQESFQISRDTTYRAAHNYLYEDLYFYDIPSGKTYASTARMDLFRRSRLSRDFIVCTDCLITEGTKLSAHKYSREFLLPETEIPEDWEKDHPELLKRPGFFNVLTAGSMADLRKGPGYLTPEQLVKDPAAATPLLTAGEVMLSPGPYGWPSYHSYGNSASLVQPFEVELSPDTRHYLLKFYWGKFSRQGLAENCFFGVPGRVKFMELRGAIGCSFSFDGKHVYSLYGERLYRAPAGRLAELVPVDPGDIAGAAADPITAAEGEPRATEDIAGGPSRGQIIPAPASVRAGAVEALKSARSHTARKEYKKAYSEYEHALAVLPKTDARRIFALERQGMLLLKEKNLAKAKKAYLDAIQTAKHLKNTGRDTMNAYSGFAYCLKKEGDIDGAARNYQIAMDLAVDDKAKTKIKKALDKLISEAK